MISRAVQDKGVGWKKMEKYRKYKGKKGRGETKKRGNARDKQ